MTGSSVRCRVSWWMPITFEIWPSRTHSLPMKPVDGPGRASQCSVMKTIFEQMASLNVSSLTPGYRNLQVGVQHLLLKIPSTHLRLQLLLQESSMKKTTPLHQPWLHCISTLHQALLHHRAPTSTLLLLLLLMGTSRHSMSSNLFGPC